MTYAGLELRKHVDSRQSGIYIATNLFCLTDGLWVLCSSSMDSTVHQGPAIICAENVSLLHLLHSVPTPPARNVLVTPKTCVQGYALSLAEERRLVESLAFLANDSDDVNHIPALCIQQDPATSTTNLLLAVNCAQWRAGIQSLRRLKNGFESIFLVLAYSGQGELMLSIEFVTLML